MAERLKQIREKSKLRRQILAQQLGAGDSADIGKLLGNKNEELEGLPLKKTDKIVHDEEEPLAKRQAVATSACELPGIFTGPVKVIVSEGSATGVKLDNKKEVEEKDDSYYEEYELVEEMLYKDSSHFLKGTQSANPHNDYCQHLVDTGQRPHNFIRDCGLADRFEEYPKLKELIRLKDEIIAQRATPPMYLKCDLEVFDLHELDCKFDVILIDPPLEEYQRRAPGCNFNWPPWTWDEISKLEIESVAAQRSFLFMWCGSHEGLDQGRMCMRKWGFRRCEDICWIKTNKNNPGNTKYLEPNSVLQHTKEHCLMGIKGTVRRSTDGDFIHANVDIDLIITEEPPLGSTEKPTEIFHIIEHFCLGRRRLHLFGSDNTLRPGWLTVGSELSSSNFSSEVYKSHFSNSPEDYLVGCTSEIEQLRPKSPVSKHKSDRGRGGGPSRGGRGGNIGRGDGVPRGGPRGGPGMGGRGGMMRGMRGFPPR